MFVIPPDFDKVANHSVSRKFNELVKIFNKYEELLKYPNSEGWSDQRRYLVKMQSELIMKGYL